MPEVERLCDDSIGEKWSEYDPDCPGIEYEESKNPMPFNDASEGSKGYGLSSVAKSNWSFELTSVDNDPPKDEAVGVFFSKAALRNVVTSWETFRSGIDNSSSQSGLVLSST